MSNYLAVGSEGDGYTFTPVEEPGNIHMVDVTVKAGLDTVMIDNSSPNFPVGAIINRIGTEDYFTVSTGDLGLASEAFPAFLHAACDSRFSVTIDATVQSPIEELAGRP